MMKIVVFAIACFFSLAGVAQQNWKPTAGLQVGAIVGGSGPGGEANLTAGLKKDNWLLGIRSGIDDYRFTTVPLMATATYWYGTKKWQPYLQAAAGWNIAAVGENEKNGYYRFDNSTDDRLGIWWPGIWTPASYSSGWMAEAGAGYALRTKKGHRWTGGLAYSAKTISEYTSQATYNGSGYEIHPATNRYLMTRVHVRIGFVW